MESCEMCGDQECSQGDEDRYGRPIYLCQSQVCHQEWNRICRDEEDDEYERELRELNMRHGRTR